MKLLKKATYSIVLAVFISFTFQCSSSKVVADNTYDKPTSFKVKPVHFQEWYAGIKVGGSGLNVFVPIASKSDNITIDSVYFRNLKGKLIQKNDRYVARLRNNSPHDTVEKSEKGFDYPFVLSDNECAISYVENGQMQYLIVTKVSEIDGIYYQNGPPSIYENNSTTLVTSNH